jgi:hypothetical protein
VQHFHRLQADLKVRETQHATWLVTSLIVLSSTASDCCKRRSCSETSLPVTIPKFHNRDR